MRSLLIPAFCGVVGLGGHCLGQGPAVDCAAMNSPSMNHSTMDHSAHAAILEACATAKLPTAAGQAAFGAISEVVRILEADPATDWSKVNIEALRQHLIDMDEVTMRSAVVQRNVNGGFEAEVTGSGRTTDAIRRMTKNHAAMLEADTQFRSTVADVPGGVRLTVVAANANDARTVARIRGLGFAGIMTEGEHHTAHHIAIARGEPVHAH
jgi:hypothetical protein